MASALERAGKTTGIKFNNDRRVHNTIRSHRLVRLADEQNKGGEMIEQLFHGYFEEGKNIADSDVLLEIAQKVRLLLSSSCLLLFLLLVLLLVVMVVLVPVLVFFAFWFKGGGAFETRFCPFLLKIAPRGVCHEGGVYTII